MTETGMMSRQGLISPIACRRAPHLWDTHLRRERTSCKLALAKRRYISDAFLILDRVGRRKP